MLESRYWKKRNGSDSLIQVRKKLKIIKHIDFYFIFLTANNLVIVMVRNSPELGMGVVFSLAFVSILNIGKVR